MFLMYYLLKNITFVCTVCYLFLKYFYYDLDDFIEVFVVSFTVAVMLFFVLNFSGEHNTTRNKW